MRFYFGASVNLGKIDLKGTKGRGNAVFGNNIKLPNQFFKAGSSCEEVDLENPVAFSNFAHEVLHIWQKQHGRQVVLEALFPQIGYSIGIHDPYKYDTSINNSGQLLKAFTSGSVEQQAQMFQNFVFQDQRNRLSRETGQPNIFDTSRFDQISQHVYWR